MVVNMAQRKNNSSYQKENTKWKNQPLIKLSPGLYIQTAVKTLCRTGKGRGRWRQVTFGVTWTALTAGGTPDFTMMIHPGREPVGTGTAPAHTGCLEPPLLRLPWGVSQASLTDDQQSGDFWATKNLKREVHQTWVKTLGHVLAALHLLQKNMSSWRHFFCQQLWSITPFRKLQENPLPTFRYLKKEENQKTKRKAISKS